MNIRSILFLFCMLTVAAGCGHKDNYVKTEGMIWNTLYHITYQGPSELQDSILPVLNEVGKSLSVFDKSSLVSRLNDSSQIIGDKHLKTVYDASKLINNLSQGIFDPTLSPLIDAWGFGLGHSPSRDTLAIDSILAFVGIEKTHREGDTIIKDDRRTRFNFSAIAKGYGCDAVGEMFLRNGVENFMVEIGGELLVHGYSPSGSDWKIAVDAPVEGNTPGTEAAMILSLTDAAVATSGNYRNYREDGGQKVAHTISPITGRPFISEILSATVISPSCMEADALATACMASPLIRAQELLTRNGFEGMLILADSIWMTPGFRNFISTTSELEGKDRN